jgi:predicted GNAT family acetyltransferase
VKINHIDSGDTQLKIVHPYVCPECHWQGIHEELIEYERVDGDGFYQGCPVCGEAEWNLKSE